MSPSCVTLSRPSQHLRSVKEKYGVDISLSMTVTLRLAKAAGIVHVPATATKAGQNDHDKPPVIVERAAASKEMHAEQHRIINPAPGDIPAAKRLLDSAPKGYVFSEAEQRLMNIQLRDVPDGKGGSKQEGPLLYLSHDEKVFWAHDGVLREWRSLTDEPETSAKLRGKGFGSSVMAAVFMSVFGIFYWEVTRYGGAKYGYWNGARMRRHMLEAMAYASTTMPSVSLPVGSATDPSRRVRVRPPLIVSATQVELLMQLDCSSCHLNYLHDALRAEDLNADGLAVRNGLVRETVGFNVEDLDAVGNSLPGATKVDFVFDYPAKDGGASVRGGWSLRLFVFANEPVDTHAKWAAASKDELVAQVRAVHISASRRFMAASLLRVTACVLPPPGAAQVKTYKNFKYEKTMLQWLALEHGHRVVYGVRFHCECAVIEAMWAYLVGEIRDSLDGTPATLFLQIISKLAYEIKPDMSGRLFNRPTEAWMLYTLGVCLQAASGSVPAGAKEIFAGLLAADVLAIQRAFSGYGNKKAQGSAHARASLAGARADVDMDVDSFSDDEADPLAVGDTHAAAPPRAAVIAAPAVPVAGAAPGGGAAHVAAAAPSVAQPAVAPLVPSKVPEEVPANLWELLSCVKEPARRAAGLDKRRLKPATYAAFVGAVQRGWNTKSGRDALGFLEDKKLQQMTPVFALAHCCVLAMRVRVWPEPAGPVAGGVAAAAAAVEPS